MRALNYMPFYVGFKTERIDNWKEIIPMPNPPRNYKNPETIKKWEEEKLMQLAQEAHEKPFSGKVVRMTILDDEDKFNFSGTAEEGYATLTKLINVEKIAIWGLDIRNKIHLTALTLAQVKNLKNTWGLFVKALNIQLSERVLLLDPIQILMGSTGETEIATVCNFLNEERLTKFIPPGDSDEQRALFVRYIVNRFNLNEKLF